MPALTFDRCCEQVITTLAVAKLGRAGLFWSKSLGEPGQKLRGWIFANFFFFAKLFITAEAACFATQFVEL